MKIMIKYFITIICIVLIFPLYAQQSNQHEMQEKIKAARIGMITERLNLTPEQAQKFWPLYNEFTGKKREVRRELNQALKNVDRENATEQEMRDLVELRLHVKQKELDLERLYSSRLLNVISTEQLVRLSKAESDFRQKVLRTIQQRRRRQEDLKRRQNPNRDRPGNRKD